MMSSDFIAYVAPHAVADMKKTGILASLTIAQAILESGFGTSELAVNGKALFGIKASNWTGKTYTKQTSEYVDGKYITVTASFRAYDSWADSIADHGAFLSGKSRYANLIGEIDYKEACRKVKEDGYATSPTYTEKLIALIERYDLTKYDKGVDRMIKIAIDAGHGVNTAGKRCLKAIDPKQTREWTLNDRIADKLEKLLKGYKCEVLRTDDTIGKTDVSLEDRVEKANKWEADIFISIHHNAGINGKSGGGTVVYYYGSENKSDANSLYNAVTGKTGLVGNRSSKIKNYGYHVLKYTNAPAFLLENGFMDSTVDTPIILTEDHATKTAEGVLGFLVSTLKLSKTATESESFLVRIKVNSLNYRAGAGVKYKINGAVKKGEVYTIVATSGSWGKLKSGAGWINISDDYVKRL